MYGVADLSVSDSNAPGVLVGLSGNKTLNNGNSRLGVRGTEDLGGGMKASFNFEQSVSAETGATDASTWQRAANMSLSGGFGSVVMGRSLTPSFFGVAAWELTGTANYSVVGSQFGFAGVADPRNSSFVSYTTPSMGGLTATIGTGQRSAGPDLDLKTDMNVIYSAGPLTAGLSYNRYPKTATPGTGNNAALGAKYNFGAFQVAGSVQDPVGPRKGFTIGAGANLGPVSLVVDIARNTGIVRNALGAVTEPKSTDTLLEVKYPLSKRTFAYGAYQRDGYGTVAAPAAVNTYGVGLRHNF